MKIEFTTEEAQALVRLIDIAIKAAGLAVAQPGFVLAQRIEQAAQDEKKSQEEN